MNIIYGGNSFQCIAKANIIIEGIDREGITNLLDSSRKILLISFCWWEDLGFFLREWKGSLRVCLGTIYFIETKNLILKVCLKKR